MEDKTTNLVKNIKTGGSMAIYIGTASIINPIIKEHNKERNAVTKFCSVVSGTVISCGVSHIASKWFGKLVDKVVDFIDDVKYPKKKEESGLNGKQ
jgi:hypothetical protein